MNKFFKWNMLITSFIPLWIAIFVTIAWDIATASNPLWTQVGNGISVREAVSQICQSHMIQLVFSAIMAIVMTIAVFYIIAFVKRKENPKEKSGVGKILSAQKSTSLVTDFLLFYILPMSAFDFSLTRDIVLFLIYFALIAFLSIRNGNVYTNVLFELMRYKIYRCDVERKILDKSFIYNGSTVISRENLTGKANQEFSFYDFENTIFFNIQSE
jgi:uncharacterized membrane protein SirB2